MKKLYNFISELFKDERNIYSIKPVIALFGIIILAIVLIIDVFAGDNILVSNSVVEGITYIVIAAIGGETADKFSLKLTKKEENDAKG